MGRDKSCLIYKSDITTVTFYNGLEEAAILEPIIFGFHIYRTTQPARDVLGTSLEGSLKVPSDRIRLDVPERQVARPRDGQKGSSGDVLGTLEGDVSRRPGDQYLPAG